MGRHSVMESDFQKNMLSEREKFIVMLDSICVKRLFSKNDKADAIVMLEGDGFSRVETTAELYQAGISDTVVFSGGIKNESYGSYPFEQIKPLLVDKGIPESALIFEGKSQNTKEQAVEVLRICETNNWDNILLVASQFHIYRAMLTFIAEWKKRNSDVRMYPVTVKNQDWFEETGYGRRIDLLEKEFGKIEKYKGNDDVADFDEGEEYLKWLMKGSY